MSNLIAYNMVNEEELYIYRYGVNALLFMLPSTICILLIGVLFHEIEFMIGFLITFALIRSYYPGGHLKTKKQCFIGSVLAIIILLISKEYILHYIPVENHIDFMIVIVLGTTMQVVKILTRNTDDKWCWKSIYILSLIKVIFFLSSIVKIYFLQEAVVFAVICTFISFILYQIYSSIKERKTPIMKKVSFD